jgi:hypothetical protein
MVGRDIMLERVISGGQTGVDQAAWRAARRAGIPTGGWMPKGYRTEGICRPEFAEEYGAKQADSPEYPPRTRLNVRDSDATLWFGADSAGRKCTIGACVSQGKPWLDVCDSGGEVVWSAEATARWIDGLGFFGVVLNVAGSRESKAPGIGAWVECYLVEVFRLLRAQQEVV